ncbi:hypothetical protein ScPMuIL_018289 [Solemya velum]
MADTSPSLVAGPGRHAFIRDRLALWDAKDNPIAPLSNKMKDCFMELATSATNRPIPLELPLDSVPPVVPLRPSQASQEDSFSKYFLSAGSTGQKIENAQQFFSWFAELEENVDKDEDLPSRCYIEELHTYRAQCDAVLEEVTSALDFLKGLQKQYVHVSTKTNALHEACEDLLAEQTHLVNTAESISNKLSYFNEIDMVSVKLGSPTLAVTNESFVPMLSRLDECIHYLTSNPRYKESSIYLARFRQCLSRALNHIKTHVTHLLQTATQQVQQKKIEIPDNPDNAFTLFYGKFRTNAPRVKALMEQLEQRSDKSPEYNQIRMDCHQCYFTQREILLGPSITSTISDLASKHIRDHCALMRSGCAFMVHVCEDEYQLYFNFFNKSTPMLDHMLEGLCNNLYDVFRPLIIHINHLETLAELCSILKIEMLEEHVQNKVKELTAFESICKQMLMDVQERLVYRTYIYIKSDILNYAAAQGDLAYPEKLEMMESIAESIKKEEKSRQHTRSLSTVSNSSQEAAQLDISDNMSKAGEVVHTGSTMPMSPGDLHGMWYPTVRRTLVTLSKLYRCIDRTTFQGLSQEALLACIQSMKNAKDGITKRKTLLDGQLFLIKHLLILREQIAPFHADFAIRETSLDFSKFKDAAYGLFQKKSQLFALNTTNALLHFILEGTPQVTEYFVDSKKDVDTQLKTTCEEFIHHVTDLFTEPLKSFIDRANVVISMKDEKVAKHIQLRQQPFATSEKLHDVVAETYKNLKTRIPVIHRSMALYLANKDTEFILFKPIKVNIQQTFQQITQILTDHYTEEDQQIVACPSAEQINLLMSTGPR